MMSTDETNCCAVGNGPTRAVDSTLDAYLSHVLDVESYPPRWSCGDWSSLEGWIHIGSDTAIFTAYLMIAAILVFFTRKQPGIPYRGLILLFSAFILSCGTGHLLEAVIFYWPAYRLAGLVKFLTALVSWLTVIALVFVIPKALRLPGLAAANKRLKRADQAKSQFLANMSHEIRTPMTAILGYADLIAHCEDDDQRRDYARTIQRNGEHLLTVLNDILDLSKIESGRLDLEQISFEPRRIIEESMELQRLRAEGKGLKLVGRIAPGFPPRAVGDPVRLRQVLLNLIGNAIKFTELGCVTVEASVLENDSSASMRIEIVDTGIGMTGEQLASLFQPFTQADASTTRKYGGTGLGLTISHRLMQLMDGSIEVDSSLGQGSTFRITLPLKTPPRQSEPSAADGVSPAVASDNRDHLSADGVANRPGNDNAECDVKPSRPLRGLSILLVEDGVDNQRLISTLLRLGGATVEVAEHGGRALEVISTGGPLPDVILMDMQMPVLDGYQTTERLRELGIDVPIIALTAHAMATDRVKCLAAGCNEHASKPIKKSDLFATILRVLDRSLPDTQQQCSSSN